MDMYQIRALELEIEQLKRYQNYPEQKKTIFYDDRFEIDQLEIIRRYRRRSKTYKTPA